MALTDGGDEGPIAGVQHAAGRHRRAHHQQRDGPVRHGRGEGEAVEPPLAVDHGQRREHRHAARQPHTVDEPRVDRVGEHDLVAGIERRQQHVQHALGAAARHDDLGLRVIDAPVPRRDVVGDRRPQPQVAGERQPRVRDRVLERRARDRHRLRRQRRGRCRGSPAAARRASSTAAATRSMPKPAMPSIRVARFIGMTSQGSGSAGFPRLGRRGPRRDGARPRSRWRSRPGRARRSPRPARPAPARRRCAAAPRRRTDAAARAASHPRGSGSRRARRGSRAARSARAGRRPARRPRRAAPAPARTTCTAAGGSRETSRSASGTPSASASE